jgi:hypothetical protein
VPVLAVVLAGVGVVGLGAFAIVGAKSLSDYADLRDSCGKDHSCTEGDLDRVATERAVADICLGTGVAALVGATIVYLVRPAVPRSGGVRSGLARGGPRLSVAF